MVGALNLRYGLGELILCTFLDHSFSMTNFPSHHSSNLIYHPISSKSHVFENHTQSKDTHHHNLLGEYAELVGDELDVQEEELKFEQNQSNPIVVDYTILYG